MGEFKSHIYLKSAQVEAFQPLGGMGSPLEPDP